MSDALVVERVSKSYASHQAVRELSLTVPEQTIYGILGPNGAGKSTLLRMVMSIIARDGGSIRVLGQAPEARGVLRAVGYLPEERGLYRGMSVSDVIIFFGRLKGLSRATARREAATWLERMGLEAWRDARVDALSKGMQQKVQFIATVVHQPRLIILDEPQSGLDPVNQEVLRESILALRSAGCTVVFSTHNMDQAESLCEAVCIIAGGEKVLDGSVRDVKRAHRGNHYRLHIDALASRAALPQLRHVLQRAAPSVTASDDGALWEFELDGGSPRELLARLAELPLELERFERVEPTLHEVFLTQVGEAARRPARRDGAHA